MHEKETLEYNKRCAEFLGAIYSEQAEAWGFGNAKNMGSIMWHGVMYNNVIQAQRFEKELKFHSDWNWIMEVVEAIQKIVIQNNDEFCIEFYEGLPNECTTFVSVNNINTESINAKEAVVEAINQFLILYEQNKNIFV